MPAKLFNPAAKPEHIQRTERAQSLTKLAAIYDGKQYEGRADWWTGSKRGDKTGTVPLRERKPCVVYRLPRAATTQVVRFLFGEGRFPQISVKSADEDGDGDTALSKDDAELVQNWIAKFIEKSSVKPKLRALARRGIATGTACAILEISNGEFRIEMPEAQHCAPTFRDDDPSKQVEGLVWCYEYEAEVEGNDGHPRKAKFLFRRDYDATAVYAYEPVEVKHGATVKWGTPVSTAHGLGFCPVVWVRNEGDSASGIDGVSLFEGLEEEFEALDFTMSQRYRGIVYLGAPQPVETGVEAGDGPGASGRTAGPQGYGANSEYGAVAAPARRMAPDEIWSYEGEQVKLELLETSGKAFEVASLHVDDIRGRCLETMGVVLTSLTETVSRVTSGKEMSAKFLALAHAPLLNLVNEYRHNWWPYGLERIVQMALRMLTQLPKEQVVLIPDSEAVADILRGFAREEYGTWVGPELLPIWGAFFEPATTETKETVASAVAAVEARLISKETGRRHVADDFGVQNLAAEADAIEEDQASAMAEQQEKLKQEADAFHKAAGNGDSPETDRGPGRGVTAPDAGTGSGGPAAVPGNGKK